MRDARCEMHRYRGDWLYDKNLRCKARADDPIAGSTRSLRNNHRSPNQDLVAWRLCESHLRGIRTPTDSQTIASRSDESVKPTKLKARDRGINPFRYAKLRNAAQQPIPHTVACSFSKRPLPVARLLKLRATLVRRSSCPRSLRITGFAAWRLESRLRDG